MKRPFQDDIFQGFDETNRYFEGWYFKHVSSDGRYSLSVIPGISKAKEDPHAFIQVFLVKHHEQKPTLTTDYVRFPVDAFKANRQRFEVSIGENFFSKECIKLSLKNNRIPIEGEVSFSNVISLPRNWYEPSIMGPFAYLPKMECYHGIVSMNHEVHGQLNIQGQPISFDQGKGYIEKDYGRSFPSSYVWIQANHFERQDVSLFFSYATIPYLGFKFSGLISQVYVGGRHYRFATYHSTQIKENFISPQHVQYTLKKGSFTLWIEAKISEVVALPSPKNGQMNQVIKEGLSGQVTMRLTRGKQLLFEGTSHYAGIEIMKEKQHG